MLRIFIPLILISLSIQFAGCKVSTNRKSLKAPETREEKLTFYRAQLFSFETDIDFHLKNQNDLGLKSDFEKLEETLISLSAMLEKSEQDTIEQMIKDIHLFMETFRKINSYTLLIRDKDKLFTKLRRLKNLISKKEKSNAKIKAQPKVEEKVQSKADDKGIEK